jgi:hypothetical protein
MPTYVAVFALVLAYLALVTAYLALRTLARLRRATSVLARGGDGHETILEATERHIGLSEQLAADLAGVQDRVAALQAEIAERPAAGPAPAAADDAPILAELQRVKADAQRGLRNIALVRYDAFDDMAGRMSFSLALLDDAGDGVALSAITGRSDTRVYAKGVTGGEGEHELSPEERQAVDAALESTGRPGRDGLAARLARRRAG